MQKVAEGETEAQEDDVIFPRSTEVLCRGTLEPRASSAMWPFPCLHTPHCPFLHTEMQKDDHLSLFLSSPNLHIAK